jgi:hypothetical protein
MREQATFFFHCWGLRILALCIRPGFLYGAALYRLLRWTLERLFGAVFCRQVVDVNHNVQVNNL